MNVTKGMPHLHHGVEFPLPCTDCAAYFAGSDVDEGRTGAPDDSEFAPPPFPTERSVTATQLERRGYAVWTSPAASPAADARARDASRLESGAGYPDGFGFDVVSYVRIEFLQGDDAQWDKTNERLEREHGSLS